MNAVITRVVLIGLPGSGKTTVGRVLADRLGWGFVDLDASVAGEAGLTVPEIFAAEGEAGFRRREVCALARALDAGHPSVIATGGGVVVNAETADLVARADTQVVWLEISPDAAAARVGTASGRPLLDGDDAVERLRGLDAARRDRYRSLCDLSLDATAPPDAVAESVVRWLDRSRV